MARAYRHIVVDCLDDVFCARLRRRSLAEAEIHEFGEDLLSLARDEGCRKLAFSLGPGAPECLYSVFLAKLVTVQRQLNDLGCQLKLCDVTPAVYGIFEACQLHQRFDFAPSLDEAVAAWAQ